MGSYENDFMFMLSLLFSLGLFLHCNIEVFKAQKELQ